MLLVLPKNKMEAVIELAHSHPIAGHLGATNTIQRIIDFSTGRVWMRK